MVSTTAKFEKKASFADPSHTQEETSQPSKLLFVLSCEHFLIVLCMELSVSTGWLHWRLSPTGDPSLAPRSYVNSTQPKDPLSSKSLL